MTRCRKFNVRKEQLKQLQQLHQLHGTAPTLVIATPARSHFLCVMESGSQYPQHSAGPALSIDDQPKAADDTSAELLIAASATMKSETDINAEQSKEPLQEVAPVVPKTSRATLDRSEAPPEEPSAMSGDVPWAGFELTNDVQTLLDHNKLLLNEINSNHEDRGPEALARNDLLIRELNGNIDKVVKLYQAMDESFDEYNRASEATAMAAAAAAAAATAAASVSKAAGDSAATPQTSFWGNGTAVLPAALP